MASAPPLMIRSAAIAIACKPDEQNRLIVSAETSTGNPARSDAMRATFIPCSASGVAQPRMTSSISLASSCGTRSSAPLMAIAASSSGRVARSVPLKARPTGVRTDEAITTSRITILALLYCSHLFDALQLVQASFRWSEEVIVRRVAAFGFSLAMRGVAALGGRLAAVRAHPLNSGHVAKQAVSGMAHNVHQQPRNRVRIERIDVSHGFACDFATVFQLPCGTGRMLSNHFIFAIVQFGIRSLQRPTIFSVRPSLAGIDLTPRGMGVHRNLQARRRLDRIRDVRSRLIL